MEAMFYCCTEGIVTTECLLNAVLVDISIREMIYAWFVQAVGVVHFKHIGR